MPVLLLTQQAIDAGLPVSPGRRATEYCDELVAGLTLERRATSPQQGTWAYRPKVAGKRGYRRLGSTADTSLAEARKRALLLKGEVTASGPAMSPKAAKPIGVPTLSAYFDDTYLPTYAKPRLRSWKKLDGIFRMYLREKFGDCQLDQIDRQAFQAYHVGLLQKPMSPAMADHVARCLQGVLSHAVRAHAIQSHPLSGLRLLRVDNRKEQYMSPAELQRLMDVLRNDANRAVCNVAQLLLSTGTRLTEATSAKWSDIDLENRRWFIPAATAKAKRGRSVPLNDTAVEVLMAIKAADSEGKTTHVFMSPKTGEHLKYVHKVWDRLRKKAKLSAPVES